MEEDKRRLVSFDEMVKFMELYSNKGISENDVKVISKETAEAVVKAINVNYVTHPECSTRRKPIQKRVLVGLTVALIAVLLSGNAYGISLFKTLYSFAIAAGSL